MADRADERYLAEQYFRDGFCGIAAAFDLSDCRKWRFDHDAQERAVALLTELMQLFNESEILVKPKPVAAPPAGFAEARGDRQLQAFLAGCLAQRKKHAGRPRPAA